MSSPVALNVKLSKTTQTCCGKEGVKTLYRHKKTVNISYNKPVDINFKR